MKLTQRASSGLCIAFTLATGAWFSQELVFGREPGSTASKSFRTEISIEMDSIDLKMNGQEADPAMLGIPTDLSATVGYLLALQDEYVSVKDGRVTEFRRTFETVDSWSKEPDGTERSKSKDEVVDREIEFTWDEDAEEYDREFAEGVEGDDEALSGLSSDLDLWALLPDAEVEEGATWSIAGDVFTAVLLPGLDFRASLEQASTEADLPEGLLDSLSGFLEGVAATCTFEGSEEVDGVDYAVISVKGDLSESIEVDPSMFGAGLEESGMQGFTMDVEFELELEGRCLWDTAAGAFKSFELEGLGSVTIDLAVSAPEMGMDIEAVAELSLTLEQHSESDALD